MSNVLTFLNREHFQLYHTPIAKQLKSVEAAILLHEFVQRYQYHENREELIDIPDKGSGWFYHTRETIEERTALSRRQIDNGIDILKKHKLVETINHGLPCKRYFRLNVLGIDEFSKNLSSLHTVCKLVGSQCVNRLDHCEQTDSLYIEEPNKETKEEDMSESLFGRIAYSFFNRLKKENPKIKVPNFQKWAREFNLLSRDGEGNSIEEIEKVIEYVLGTKNKPSSSGFSWAANILCPTKLRKHYAQIWAEMGIAKSHKSDPVDNRSIATKIAKRFPRPDIVIGNDYLEFINGVNAPSTEIKFTDKDFKVRCSEQLRKRNLKYEDL